MSSIEIVSVVKKQKRVVKCSTKQTCDDVANLKSSCEHEKTSIASIAFLLFSTHSVHNNISIKHAWVLAEDIFTVVRIINRNLCQSMIGATGNDRNQTTEKMFSVRTHACLMDRLLHELYEEQIENVIDETRVFECSHELLN